MTEPPSPPSPSPGGFGEPGPASPPPSSPGGFGEPGPPSPPPAGATTSSGLDPHVAAMLAYLAWWVTGILFYIVERDDRFVRFHAAQSIVAFGGITAIGAVLMMGSFVLLFIWAAGFQVLMLLSQIVMLAGLLVWAICLFKAFSGEYFKLPIVGDIAERMAAK